MVYTVQLAIDTNIFTTTFTLSATISFLTLHFLKKKKCLTITKETIRNANFHTLKHKALVINRSHVISGFRREVDANCALLGYCAASSELLTDVSGQPIGPTFRDQEFLTPEGA
jgi:hypothetical protein